MKSDQLQKAGSTHFTGRKLSVGALSALALGALSELPARAQCSTVGAEQAELVAGDPGTEDYFGTGVDIEGDFAVVGAYGDNGAGTDSGAVYVFHRSGHTWAQYDKLYGSNVGTSDWTGLEVGISGDVILYGSHYDDPGATNAGSAYAWVNHDGTWIQTPRLTATVDGVSDAGTSDYFGFSVAIDGDWAVVGSRRDDLPGPPTLIDAGSAYVFWRDRKGTSDVSDDTFEPLQKLVAFGSAGPDPKSYDEFGYDVQISGDRIVVGAPLRNSLTAGDAGAAFVFLRDDNGTATDLSDDSWLPQAELQVPNAATSDYVGRGVAIDGDRIVLGANGVNHSGFSDAGAAYTFLWDSYWQSWSLEQQMVAAIPTTNAYFGFEVDVEGDRVVIGAYGDAATGVATGATYVWELCGGSWQERLRLVGHDSTSGDVLGHSVAIDGDQVISGGHGHTMISTDQGSAFVHLLSSGNFTPYCFGDGLGTLCPCGNDSPAGMGQGCRNSTGHGGILSATGSDSASLDDLEMIAVSVVPQSPILLFAGQNAVNSGLGNLFGDGLRCAGGQVKRLGVRIPSNAGVAVWGPGLCAQGGWSAGAILHFQGWYRDPISGPCGAQFNLTNGLKVILTP